MVMYSVMWNKSIFVSIGKGERSCTFQPRTGTLPSVQQLQELCSCIPGHMATGALAGCCSCHFHSLCIKWSAAYWDTWLAIAWVVAMAASGHQCRCLCFAIALSISRIKDNAVTISKLPGFKSLCKHLLRLTSCCRRMYERSSRHFPSLQSQELKTLVGEGSQNLGASWSTLNLDSVDKILHKKRIVVMQFIGS